MPPLSRLDSETPKIGDSEQNQIKGQITIPIALSSDPLYEKLIDHFQHAEFDKCKEVLDILEQRYKEHPILLRFKDDLLLKLSLQTMAVSDLKKKKFKKVKVTFRMGLFAIISTLVILVVFFFSYSYLNKISIARRLEEQAAQLVSLKEQAEQLLIAGKPQDASDIVEMIRTIDPGYVHLPELTTKTIELLLFETKYNVALELVAQNRLIEALIFLREIDSSNPGMWDVSQQIALIANPERITDFMNEGNAAYQVEMWDQVISAYENVLVLDPDSNDALMKQQLSESYLRKIPGMLQNESVLMDEIERAYQYYIKALDLTPDNEELSSERVELQGNCQNLIGQNLLKAANNNLEDKNQTSNSIADAVSYLDKAAMINQNDSAFQMALRNAQYYQTAFENIVEMNWETALSNLELIYSVNPDYANGNVRLLLYETYYALGKYYYSERIYESALKNLEQAEILSLSDSENLLKLFQVQVLLGDTIEKMGNFQEAVSYYQSALNGIQVFQRLANYPEIISKLTEAINSAEEGDYGGAFVTYKDILKGIDIVYSIPEIKIKEEGCLVFFANENLSTVDAILKANNLPDAMIITFQQNLLVPKIDR